MINSEKVEKFWESQTRKYETLPLESIANLEEDTELLALKVQLEKEKIFSKIDIEGKKVLDLGAGVGQWSFRFAERCKNVWAVEYIAGLVSIAEKEAEKRKLNNIRFINQNVVDFTAKEIFDLIYISGLLIYLTDDECRRLIQNIVGMSSDKTQIILRDGTGVLGRHIINDLYSENLDAYYSADYRTAEEYIKLFAEGGLNLVSAEDMFQKGSKLNKYRETRLRVYLFTKK